MSAAGAVGLDVQLEREFDDAGFGRSVRALDRLAVAHDASHYLLVPDAVLTPVDAAGVSAVFRASASSGRPITFRSGGTSLSGQGVSSSILVDTRRNFRRIEVLDDGARVRVQPGATVRQVNARLARHGRKLGPDPASEIACTIGGVIANNSSGMACGIEQNTYRTLESMTLVLPNGAILDTAAPDADEALRLAAPSLHSGLASLRNRVLGDPASVAEIRRQYAMKNTMGYGLNTFLDFTAPVDLLTHLLIGSEGTLGFVAEATFRTVPLASKCATGLLVFETLAAATEALPGLVECGFATIELLDSRSLTVAQSLPDCPAEIAAIEVAEHCALLVEFQASTDDELSRLRSDAAEALTTLARAGFTLSSDAGSRAALWHVRKGLYPALAGSRRSGTTALLEDFSVPVGSLLDTCEALTGLLRVHGYTDSVIFGHARDGNLHFLVVEDFRTPAGVERYAAFTEDLVRVVLAHGGSLKAEHGTGRVMAPFVREQFGDELYDVMHEVKRLFDPLGLLNPGVVLSDDRTSYLNDLKIAPAVESEVDRCVECGYCEPTCPSRDITLTPRQRIVLRREIETAKTAGDQPLLRALEGDYGYQGVETCAVDGLCAVACPVGINTGDLVRRLRSESQNGFTQAVGAAAAANWGTITAVGGVALSAAKQVPAPLVAAVTSIGRSVLGKDVLPHYSADLPGGGRVRRAAGDDRAVAVYFPACVGTMFGPSDGSMGVRSAFQLLCERAGVALTIPDGVQALCCGTPWKSKGLTKGYDEMRDRTLPALFEASRGGDLPIVCDASSCSEGLETLRSAAAKVDGRYRALRFIDSVEFTLTEVAPHLVVESKLERLVLHHTCSSTAMGANGAMDRLASLVAAEVVTPLDEGCCAFAGDRGMLHPELTRSATASEAAEVGARRYDAYASSNRTCEIGMTRATGQPYRHLLEVLEEQTRPSPSAEHA